MALESEHSTFSHRCAGAYSLQGSVVGMGAAGVGKSKPICTLHVG